MIDILCLSNFNYPFRTIYSINRKMIWLNSTVYRIFIHFRFTRMCKRLKSTVKRPMMYPKQLITWLKRPITPPEATNDVIQTTKSEFKAQKNPSQVVGKDFCEFTGVAGFEPTSDGVKVRCLTAWLYPKGREFPADLFSISALKICLNVKTSFDKCFREEF
jgi:hypothetical protein